MLTIKAKSAPLGAMLLGGSVRLLRHPHIVLLGASVLALPGSGVLSLLHAALGPVADHGEGSH